MRSGGGTIKAEAQAANYPGIGGRRSGNITITGGDVTAVGGSGGAGIGKTANKDESSFSDLIVADSAWIRQGDRSASDNTDASSITGGTKRYVHITFGDGSDGSTVTGVSINPTAAEVRCGKTQQFTAEVIGGSNANKAIRWSVSGNTSADTVISNGLLTVGRDETAEKLTVTATSSANANKKASASVSVFSGIDLTDEQMKVSVNEDWTYGDEAQVNAEVIGVDGEFLITYNYSSDGGNTWTEEIPSDAGDYQVRVWFESETHEGEKIVPFTIAQKDISEAVVTLADTLTYSGILQTQKISAVSLDGKVLGAECYEVTGDTGTAADSYTLSVLGIGNYTGEISVPFEIRKKTLAVESVILKEKEYDANASAVVEKVIFNGLQNNEILSLETDFTVEASYQDANAGENKPVSVTIVLNENSQLAANYQLSEITEEVFGTILPKTVTAPIIKLEQESYKYAGEPVEPTVLAVKDGEVIIPDGEYTIEYSNNQTAGTGTVKILDNEGGNYVVSGEQSFTILACLHDDGYSNGFCVNCNAYEPAVLENGVYQIKNGGNLFWFAALVNGDGTHAEGVSEAVPSASAVLVSSINLENRQWTPIGGDGNVYTGEFNGCGNTITGMSIADAGNYSGLFGSSNGTVRDFTLYGEITTSFGDFKEIGGVVGYLQNGTVSGVTSCVNMNVNTAEGHHVGGVAGSVGENGNGSARVEQCIYAGTLNANETEDCTGGIVGILKKGTIENCANQGSVTGTKTSGNVSLGGILGYCNERTGVVRNCYSTGTVTAAADTYCGAIVGWARNSSMTVENCYYQTGTADRGIGVGSGRDDRGTAQKEESAFADGEVTWLLNGGTNGTQQVWRQNLDNEAAQTQGKDLLPQFNGGAVYYGYLNCGSEAPGYTNVSTVTAERPDHIFDGNGRCTICEKQAEASVTFEDGESAYYFSVEEAFSAAAGQTVQVKLLTDADVEADIRINNKDSSITFDLNGKTMNFDTDSSVLYALYLADGTLTVKDSGNGTGMMTGEFTNIKQTGGTLTIENGTFQTTSAFSVIVAEAGTLIIKNGSFLGCEYGGEGIYVKNVAVTIENGLFSGGNASLQADDEATALELTIYDGVFNGSLRFSVDWVAINNKAKIYGGTFNGDSGKAGLVIERSSSALTLYGGTFNGIAINSGVVQTYLASGKAYFYTDTGKRITDRNVLLGTQIAEKVTIKDENPISVDVSWGAMEFVYSDGEWNPDTHTYQNGGWTPKNDSNIVTVQNNGTEEVKVSYVFERNAELTELADLTGRFTSDDGGLEEIYEAYALPAGSEETAYLQLNSEKPNSDFSGTLGMVTVKLGEE